MWPKPTRCARYSGAARSTGRHLANVSSPSARVNLNDPTTVALLAADALHGTGHRYALYGGLLTAVYGEPRETRDADVAVVNLTANEAARALRPFDVRAAVAFDRVDFGGLTLSRLTIMGPTPGEAPASSGLNTIDLVRPRSLRYAALAVDRAVTTSLRGHEIRLLTLEDFILFKVLSTRDRDLHDAHAALARSRAALDRGLVLEEIAALSRELPDVDVTGRWTSVETMTSGE